jgi:hypothetical protein
MQKLCFVEACKETTSRLFAAETVSFLRTTPKVMPPVSVSFYPVTLVFKIFSTQEPTLVSRTPEPQDDAKNFGHIFHHLGSFRSSEALLEDEGINGCLDVSMDLYII